jgi:hypothetical protein
MKTLTKIFSLTTLLAILGTTSLKAQGTDISRADSTQTTQTDSKKESTKYILLDNSITNKNMFFGMNFGNMMLNQSYLEVGNKNVTVSTWTNYNIEKKHLIEIDFFASYKKTLALGDNTNLTLQPGVGYLTFPNQDPELPQFPDFREINFKATLTSPIVDASIRAGKAFGGEYNPKDISDCSMVDFDLSKTIKSKNGKFSATGNLETIYNSNYFSGAKGISHTAFTGSASYSPLENVTITASATNQNKVNQEMPSVNSECYYKVGLTYTFK